MIALPPAGTPEGAGIVGWRDPFVFEFKGQDGHEQWGILMGSGRKTTGGAIMIYRSRDLCSGAVIQWAVPLLLACSIHSLRQQASRTASMFACSCYNGCMLLAHACSHSNNVQPSIMPECHSAGSFMSRSKERGQICPDRLDHA